MQGGCVIKLGGTHRLTTPVPARPDAPLHEFMQDTSRLFSQIDLPLGGQLRTLDPELGLYELQVPRIQLFDLWLAPHAQAHASVQQVTTSTGQPSSLIRIQGHDCVLHGSSHVQQFRLNERFTLDIAISFTSVPPPLNSPGGMSSIITDGQIEIQVDIPPPFSFMPKGVLEATGNAAMQSTLGLLLGAVVQSVVKDYPAWAQSHTASSSQ